MAKNPHAEGASKSLIKTIRELEDVLAGIGLGPTRSALRSELRSKVGQLAQRWFRRGFRRGCIETNRLAKSSGKLPKKISYDARRDFFDGRKQPVSVKWKSK